MTTARFQQSNDLGRKLNKVRAGKNITNVILTDRHSRVSTSKQKISFSRLRQYDQQNNFAKFQSNCVILQTHTLTLKYDKGLVSQLHVAYLGKKSNTREGEFSAQDIRRIRRSEQVFTKEGHLAVRVMAD